MLKRLNALLLGSVLLGSVLLAGCASHSPPDVALVGLTPLESTLLEPRMRLEFRLQNTGTRAMNVRGLNLALKVNGVELARGVDNQGFVLPGLGETRAAVDVGASLFNLAQLLLTLPSTETFSYELDGRLHLDGFPRSLPVRRGGSITRAQLQQLTGNGGRRPGALRLE